MTMTEKLFQIEGDQDTRQLNVMNNQGLYSGPEEEKL